jgi:hypothetical protein
MSFCFAQDKLSFFLYRKILFYGKCSCKEQFNLGKKGDPALICGNGNTINCVYNISTRE